MLAFASPQRHYPAFNPNAYCGSMYHRPPPSGGDFFRESIRELAHQRARKAQWLPDEVNDSDDEFDDSHLGPRERRYLETMKMQQSMDRMRNEHEVRARAMQQAEEERTQNLEQRRVAQDARQRQMIREVSEMRAAALEREANVRAKMQHEHNAFTAGGNYPPSRPCRAPSARGSSPLPKVNPIPKPESRSTPNPLYTEKHETAASVIQQNFRIHRSLHTIGDIASEFESLKSAFASPTVLDFQEAGSEEGHISVTTSRTLSESDKVDQMEEDEEEVRMEVDVPLPKLAYSAVNYPIHSYADAMEKLLMRLDGVESCGDKGVRERRRSVVREVGKESAKLERFWKQVWMDYAEKQREGASNDDVQEVLAELDEKMETDEEPVHVEHPKVEDTDDWFQVDVAELAPVVPNGDAKIEIENRPNVLPSFAEAPITSMGLTPSDTLSDEAGVTE